MDRLREQVKQVFDEIIETDKQVGNLLESTLLINWLQNGVAIDNSNCTGTFNSRNCSF